jgi:hypothetical protein
MLGTANSEGLDGNIMTFLVCGGARASKSGRRKRPGGLAIRMQQSYVIQGWIVSCKTQSVAANSDKKAQKLEQVEIILGCGTIFDKMGE